MTKVLAASYRAALLDNGVDLISGNVKLYGMTASYTYSAAHDFLNDVTNIVYTSSNLTTKTAVDGAFDSDSASASPAGGSTITQFWLALDSGVTSTSPLVYYFDEDAAAAAISIATDGTAKTVDPGASGWFRV